jgi:replicative DNA helicase
VGFGAARDSGVIEEALDYLVTMWRPDRAQGLNSTQYEKVRNDVMVKLLKNRHGETGAPFRLKLNEVSLKLE